MGLRRFNGNGPTPVIVGRLAVRTKTNSSKWYTTPLNFRVTLTVHTQFRNVAAGPVIQTQRKTIYVQKLISWSSSLCLSLTERIVMCSKLQCLHLALLWVWTLSKFALSKNTQRLRNWICPRSQVDERGEALNPVYSE
jgi:hypothetical protein